MIRASRNKMELESHTETVATKKIDTEAEEKTTTTGG